MRALMTQKSCAAGMRMAKLGNHLKGSIVCGQCNKHTDLASLETESLGNCEFCNKLLLQIKHKSTKKPIQ